MERWTLIGWRRCVADPGHVLRLFELLPFGNGIIGRHASNLLIIRISCELANEHRKAKVDVDYSRLTLDSLFFTFKKKTLDSLFFLLFHYPL